MRTRALVSAALVAALAAGAVASGCGGVGVSGAAGNAGDQLTIYSSLPLQGSSAAVSQEIVNGEKLALAEAGGHVGPFKVAYDSMDDSNPQTGRWDPGITAADAKTAAQDTTTIAYLGDYNSAASAVSLPLMNAAGILQVSPASPYVGLTSSLDAGQDEPERFYPTGKRSFGRLMPADPAQAAAQVQLMGALKVGRLYVLDDQDPFQVPLAQIVIADAEKAGIRIAGSDSVDTTTGNEFAEAVQRVVRSGAQAVFFSGAGSTPGAVALWRELHAADPQLLLLGTDSTVTAAFAAELGAAGEGTYVSTPVLPIGQYPVAARRVLDAYRARFHAAGTPEALYGYETMSVVLQAIRAAGAKGNEKQAVIDHFFQIHDRDSVLGRYSIQSNGDSTLSRYGIDRVLGGRLVFYKALAVGPG